MSDINFTVENLNLIGSDGYATIESNNTIEISSKNYLNLNADTVGISTDITIGGQVASDLIIAEGFYVGIGTDNPTSALTVNGDVNISGTVVGGARVTGQTTLNNDLSVVGVSTFSDIAVFESFVGFVSQTAFLEEITASGDVNVSGVVTATSFVGDGSGLTGIVATGTGVEVQDDGSPVGTAATINFGTGLSVSPISSGVVTVTATGGGGGGESYWTETSAGIHTLSNVGIGTTAKPWEALTVNGDARVTGTAVFEKETLFVEEITAIAEINALGGVLGNVTGTASFATVAGISTYTSEWILGAVGSSDYTFTGPGFTGAESDPVLYLVRGQQYKFTNTMGAHPFRIQSTPNGSTGTQYDDGIVNNNVSNGTLTWNVQFNAPGLLYYQCTAHGGMGGKIYIIDAGVGPDISINTTGIVTSFGGFSSELDSSPVQISVSNGSIIFNVVGIGSTSFELV